MSGFRIVRAAAGLGGLAALLALGDGWNDLVAVAGAALAALGLLLVAAGRLRPASDALAGLGALVGLSRLGGGWDEPSTVSAGIGAVALLALALAVPDEGMPRVRWARAGPAWLAASALVAGIVFWVRGPGAGPSVLVWDPQSPAGLSLRVALAVVLLAAVGTLAWWLRGRGREADATEPAAATDRARPGPPPDSL